MKKFIIAAAVTLAAATALAGCSKKSVNLYDYISEKRTDIYQYSTDGLDFFINYGYREQPFETDGFRGEIFRTAEAVACFSDAPDEVAIKIGGETLQMNYDAAQKNFSLNLPDPNFGGDGVDVTLVCDGKETSFTAQSVLYDGVMSCESALDCVREHDGGLFSSLTDGDVFEGEIFVRLLYDDGCYYYVGVCDRQGKISAYLLDGERGKILATKKL